jgi:hypoxanthine phosphoribosyltransferase
VPLSREQALRVLEAADLVCPAAAVSDAVARLGREISAAVADSFPLVLCVMRGGLIFGGQLLPLLRFPLELGYLDVTRYGDATRGADIVWNAMPPAAEVTGRLVLVLDDILDEGHTLAAVREKLLALGASRVLSAVFAEKEIGRAKAFRPDFTGVKLPDRYVFGFGMDVRGAWRNLPEIYALNEGGER